MLKCEKGKVKGCQTCGYKDLLLKEGETFCRVCNRQDEDKCPILNKKNPITNCDTCSWKTPLELNIDAANQRLKDNLRFKKDDEYREKVLAQQAREEKRLKEEEEKKKRKSSLGYNSKGLYNGYDRNNEEREALDYYATPPWEVKNILLEMGLRFSDHDLILEPCAGGLHMVDGIVSYLKEKEMTPYITATDIKDRSRPNHKIIYDKLQIGYGEKYDFFSDDYVSLFPDYTIMNPPFNVCEGFVQRALRETKKGVLCFARLQFLETKKRYETILKNNPPTYIYVYIDRVKCYRNGDFKNVGSSAQAYAWFYWVIGSKSKEPVIRWLHRAEENEQDWGVL